ncbi:hypothetical protein KP509_20G014300 [Ceratopteris richardii]|uniref:Uncharacterized protein n=1 Tax=Ceratopteris richardii TaxID=49495 RepID=A0A8T2SF00_CERRI|nr:hypothetical protein KP509_20G014300 [Ceratopteris richardii]
MVITTFPDGEDAQADTVLDDALTIPSAAVTSFISDTPHTHRHSIILEEKARHSALGSLWIERLKSRDEPNGFNAEEHCSSERSPKSLLVIKETGICERATSICETAHLIRKFDQGAQNSSLSLRINGYVKQLNPTQSATREEKSQTMSIMNSSFTSKQCKLSQTSDQALEVHSSALQRSQSQRRLLTSTSGKPPLPPMHRKSGFLPWHPVHKSQGFSSSRAGKITSPAINEKHADAPRNIALDNKESFLTLGKSGLRPLRKEKQHTQDFKEDVLTRDGKFLLPEAKCTPDGLFSARTASSQDLRVNSSKINVFVTPPVGIGGDGCPIRHQDCRNMVTTIEEMESLKNLSGLEIDNVAVLKGQSAATGEGLFCDFHSDRSALNPIGDSSGSFLKSNKGLRRSFTASVTTCSSWESLDESAGPSRRKVQQVHRAVQNDLQSQRMPSLISKVTNDKSKSCGVLDSRRDLCVKIMPITMCEDRLSEKEQYSESQPYRKFKVESDDKSSQVFCC